MPGDGDTVTIANTHTVTLNQDLTVGASTSTAAIAVATGGICDSAGSSRDITGATGTECIAGQIGHICKIERYGALYRGHIGDSLRIPCLFEHLGRVKRQNDNH